jgi:hypothetical protein
MKTREVKNKRKDKNHTRVYTISIWGIERSQDCHVFNNKIAETNTELIILVPNYNFQLENIIMTR